MMGRDQRDLDDGDRRVNKSVPNGSPILMRDHSAWWTAAKYSSRTDHEKYRREPPARQATARMLAGRGTAANNSTDRAGNIHADFASGRARS